MTDGWWPNTYCPWCWNETTLEQVDNQLRCMKCYKPVKVRKKNVVHYKCMKDTKELFDEET